MNQLLFEKRDLHPHVRVSNCRIGDLGLSVLKSEAGDIRDIKGVMPYLAPELLNGRMFMHLVLLCGKQVQESDFFMFMIHT